MSKLAEELRSWSDVIQQADIEKNIEDGEEQTLINRTDKQQKREEQGEGIIKEMPERFDVYGGDRNFADDTLKSVQIPEQGMIDVADHGQYKTIRNPNGSMYVAIDKNGNKVGFVSGVPGKQNILKVDVTTAASGSKGVMYQLFMDILGDGKRILSDTQHSEGAERFWTRLIQDPKHFVYIVFDRKPQMRATPEKLHKYWGEEGSVSAGIQFLLMK